jgi:hypothetical protein
VFFDGHDTVGESNQKNSKDTSGDTTTSGSPVERRRSCPERRWCDGGPIKGLFQNNPSDKTGIQFMWKRILIWNDLEASNN